MINHYFCVMDERETYISEFRKEEVNESTPFDFSKMESYGRGGSICDTFVGRHFRRKVFVKRLKEEFRKSSLHLAALDKEYDVGVNLNHVSLPRYLEFHEDYIVMDFIDGDTLASLIENNDPWLQDKRNIWKMLEELVDVIGYLHRNHVVHCDIKPDNILLTRDDRKLVLIDLDKCYTDWLDNTSGSTALFGKNDHDEISNQIDFKGVAFIIDCIVTANPNLQRHEFSKIKKKCLQQNVSEIELINYIRKKLQSNKERYVLFSLAGMIIVLLVGLVYTGYLYNSKNTEAYLMTNKVDTVLVVQEMPQQPTLNEISSQEQKDNQLNEIIDKELPALSASLNRDLDSFLEKIQGGDVSSDELMQTMMNLSERTATIVDSCGTYLIRKYPEFKINEVISKVRESELYYNLSKKHERIAKIYLDTIIARVPSYQ